MADERKVFPLETVLALVYGKDGDKVRNLASYITGRTVLNENEARIVAPFAGAWLYRWYPKFMNHEWGQDEPWDAFVAKARHTLGDNISLAPMDERMKKLCADVLENLEENARSLANQTEAALVLEEKARELESLRERSRDLQKKCDDLEAKLKAMKTDLNAAQRKLAGFEGKLAIDHEDLIQNIKDAIKDGLKGLSIGGAVAGTIASASEASSEPVVQNEPDNGLDEFGFGSGNKDSDGFGF